MKLTYTFSAQTVQHRRPVSGLIVAVDPAVAYFELKRMGLTRYTVSLNLLETLASWLGAIPDQRELARFYRTLGIRLKNGGNPVDAVSGGLEYLDDERLKTQVAIFAAQLAEGQKPHDAMRLAGFDARECTVVGAYATAGNYAEAFANLAVEIADRYRLTQSVKGMLRMPLIMSLLVWFIALPGVFLGLAPPMMKFFKQAGNTLKIPESIQSFYAFVGWTQQNPWPTLLLFLGIPTLIWWGIKTPWFMLQLERVKDIRRLSIANDHAMLWGAYSVLYRAGINPAEICPMLSKSAARTDTRESLIVMGRRLKGGDDEITAVSTAKFPKFVLDQYRAAKTSGALADGLIRFVADLKEDIELLTQKISDIASVASYAALGLLTLAMAYVVLYPAMGTALSNL